MEIGTVDRVLRDRRELDASESLADRLVLAAEIRERETEEDVALRVFRRLAELLLVRLARLLGVDARVRGIAFQDIRLREADAPTRAVAVEGVRRQAKEELLLLLVENPDEVLVVRYAREGRPTLFAAD